MKLSISVMAHIDREKWFPYLKENLNNAPISVDDNQKRLGVWGNRKQATKLYNKDAKYHLVIQDDAILCEDFIKRTEDFIEKIDSEFPDELHAFQLYHGHRANFENKKEMLKAKEKGYIKRNMLAWGVAIIVPTSIIEEMLRWCNGHSAWQDDTKMKHFFSYKGMPVYYPVPCLVDHRHMNENPTLVPSKDSDRFSPYFIDTDHFGMENYPSEMAIPKIIHQIWIGDKNKMPTKLMDTWKMECWKYMLWTEKEIDEMNLENRHLYDYYYSKKCWHGASDVVRLEVLKKYGGIYIDADTERLANIEPLLVFDYVGIEKPHEYKSFFAVEANLEGRVANGVIGSVPNHPIILNYIKSMGEAVKIDPPWSTIGGTMLTEMIGNYSDERTQILKPHTFYPFDSKGNSARTRGITYARHFWGSTHRIYNKL